MGVATAIGLSLGASAELVAVTSLEVLAHGAHSAGVRGAVVCAVDARRGELFVQTFELGEGVLARADATVRIPGAVVAEWSESTNGITFTGDGATRYESVLREVSSASFFDQRVPPPIEALRLGASRSPDVDVVPLYLREPDAVANFSTRTRP